MQVATTKTNKLALRSTTDRIKLVEPAPAANFVRRPGWRGWFAWMWFVAWSWCTRNPGWFVSALFHAVLVLCLADILLNEQREAGRVGIEAVLGDDAGGADSFETILDRPAARDAAAEESSEPVRAVTSLLGSQQAADPSALAAVSGPSGQSLLGSGSVGEGKGLDGSGIGFFGTSAEGNSFVYIVDMSASMGGQRFPRAVGELVRSIGKLKPNQKFYVIFFNDQPIPLYFPKPAKGMVTATPANRAQAVRWIRHRDRKPESFTNPDGAIEMALEMKPDAIFLLTDGEFAPYVPALIKKLNTGDVSVHTIAFEGREGEDMLEAIAKENKGTYRYVK